jgi:hypothetical protein
LEDGRWETGGRTTRQQDNGTTRQLKEKKRGALQLRKLSRAERFNALTILAI